MAGIKLIKVLPGYAVATMTISDNHLNAADVVQGGAIFTLADLAFAAASNSHGQLALALNCTITFIKAAKGKVLTAEAKEVALNNRTSHYEISVTDDNEELIAKLLCTAYRKSQTIDFDREA